MEIIMTVFLTIFIIIIFIFLAWFLIIRPQEKREKKRKLRAKKERRRISAILGKECFFCENYLSFDDEEIEDNKINGLIPMCYKCAGKLEKWNRINI